METGMAISPIQGHPFEGECEAAWLALQGWKDQLLDYAVDNPVESLILVVTGAALVIHLAEREVNDGFNTYDDALYYICTCLSVGYANVFPKTQLGKLVAAIVMAIGPSLSNWMIEGRLVARTAAAERTSGGAETRQGPDLAPVVDKLDEILQELKAQRTAA